MHLSIVNVKRKMLVCGFTNPNNDLCCLCYILGIVLNGDITKEVDTENRDVEMEEKDVDMDSISVNKVLLEAASESKEDVSMEDKEDVEMESRDELTNSAMDDDSQDSRGSQTRFACFTMFVL